LSLLRVASAGLPQDASVQYHLAAALNATGEKDQARTVLEKLVKSGTGFDDRADAQQLLNTLQHD
jgi:cellulose synthase operon protein C